MRFRLLFLLLSTIAVLNATTLDLSGVWRFALDDNDVGIRERWFARTLPETVHLPGSNVENLKGYLPTLETKFTGSIYDSSWFFNPHLERYRHADNFKMPFWLTQERYYVGPAWYQRDIVVPADWKGKQIQLHLERVHFISKVWINNVAVGGEYSLNTPHEIDLTQHLKPGRHRITIRVDNRLDSIDVGANSHSVTDHTQGNWNGIVGTMELRMYPGVHFEDIQVYPDIRNKLANVKLQLANQSGRAGSARISLGAESFNSAKKHSVTPVSTVVQFARGERSKLVEMTIVMGDAMQTWDEFSPALYRLHAHVTSDKESTSKQLQFGMREVSIEGKWIYINGRKTQMRGTVENALFPLTGYPPTDVASWERVFRICKAWGLNHVRYHSYGPPEAAFIAADLVGIYLQPEGPSWPNHTTQLGRGFVIDTYLMEETQRMVKDFGNYASFVMLAAGNEPRGNWVPWVSRFVDYWKETDSRRIYTGASVGGSWSWQPRNQFHVKAGARGLNWSRSQPESMSDFRNWIDTVGQPFISHETGQWCVFPNFDEIKKYTGVTRARNFEMFRDELIRNDLGELSHEFLMASGKLQALSYKHEIERTMRTPDYAGFQLLSLNDFSGQGSAIVGLLDAFWDEKGYVSAADFRRFCNSTVPLIRTEKFVYRNNETFNISAELSHFGPAPFKNANVIWRIRDVYGLVLEEHSVKKNELPIGCNIPLFELKLDLSGYQQPKQLNFEIQIAGTDFVNDWDFWVYPAQLPALAHDDIYITETMDEKSRKVLNEGGKVLVLAAGKIEYGKDVVQYYSPVFWNTSWFKMRPPHTTGVFVQHYHPVFRDFVTDNWANMHWWELVNRTQTMLLTDFPKGYQPIVQPIDTWFINRKLGMLIEAKVGNGLLMMTTMDLQSRLENRPVAEHLYHSIIRYMKSPQFRPDMEVPMQNIIDLFEKTAPPIDFFSRSSPDELRQGAI